MRLSLALPLIGVLFPLVAPAGASAVEDRPAAAILADLEAVAKPPRGDLTDAASARSYFDAMRQYNAARSALVAELARLHPDDPGLEKVLLERWRSPYLTVENRPEDLTKEAEAVVAGVKDEKLVALARYVKANAALTIHRDDPAAALPAVEELLRLSPGEPRGPVLLYSIARAIGDEAKLVEVEDRILKDFPDASVVGSIRNARKQRELVGKPFELEFTDAVGGKPVSIAGLKGKVVVVDFWATWCGPCVAEMPKMKDLYARYHDKGVEFVGVSLDKSEADGGLKALKEFVERNEVPWPQYYQGDFWQSDFSLNKCFVHSIPSLFVVDKQGVLASVEARGKLDELLPRLLAADGPETR